MSVLGTRFVLFWFAALIPPPSEDDIDYYAVLGVSSKATKEEIRKAYKKKSLTLHPDKILQRGGNPDDFRKEYQDIQEAHTVLSDDKKRQTYNMVNKSSTRYKFLTEEGAVAAGYDHLGKATCEQKSRLVLLVAILIMILLTQPILVCVKVNHELEGGPLESSPWMAVLIPWWIINFLFVLVMLLMTVMTECNQVMLLKLLETVSFVIGQLMLALRWDETLTNDYTIIFIPIYIALALRWLGRYLIMQQMKFDILRMITLPKLEQEIGKKYEDMTEEEQLELQEEFIIVHLPPDAPTVQAAFGEDFVQLSPEYQAAMEAYYSSFSALVIGMVFGIPMIILLVLKIDEVLPASWWLIFMPAWIYLGTQMLWSCYGCCCASVGEEVLVEIESDDEGEGENNEEAENRDGSAGFAKPDSNVKDFTDQAQSKTEEEKPVAAGPSSSSVPSAPVATKPAPSDPNILEETKVEDVDDAPELDEEAYAEFEEAYEQAEANAAAAQAKASSSLCALLFQLTILCLIVGKLEHDVPPGDSVGYNALWILFPILLIAGCTLCCWACLIYGAGKEGLDNLVDRATAGDKKDGDEEAPATSEEPIAMPAPPVEEPSEKKAETPAAETPQEEEVGYDDDLD